MRHEVIDGLCDLSVVLVLYTTVWSDMLVLRTRSSAVSTESNTFFQDDFKRLIRVTVAMIANESRDVLLTCV